MTNSNKINLSELNESLTSRAGFYARPVGADTCEYEGCFEVKHLELHHLNPMVNTKRKGYSAHERSIIAQKRKTVTLCRKHHQLMHNKGILATINKK